MIQSLEQTFGITEQEMRGINKQIKRALLGRFGRQRKIPKMEAACLLVRRRVTKDSLEAKKILDSIVGRKIYYGKRDNIFDFEESGDVYHIYVRYWFR